MIDQPRAYFLARNVLDDLANKESLMQAIKASGFKIVRHSWQSDVFLCVSALCPICRISWFVWNLYSSAWQAIFRLAYKSGHLITEEGVIPTWRDLRFKKIK
jgi:hypothetical protein